MSILILAIGFLLTAGVEYLVGWMETTEQMWSFIIAWGVGQAIAGIYYTFFD